jgi:hypothetical protein
LLRKTNDSEKAMKSAYNTEAVFKDHNFRFVFTKDELEYIMEAVEEALADSMDRRGVHATEVEGYETLKDFIDSAGMMIANTTEVMKL